MRSIGFAIGAGVALAGLIVACKTPVQPAVTTYQQSDEITTLWAQIRQWRHEARMDLDPGPTWLIGAASMKVSDAKRSCVDGHEVPKTCEDICGLADAICDNAETICSLAADLGKANTWAQDKCTSAKASCRESKQRCCDCGAK